MLRRFFAERKRTDTPLQLGSGRLARSIDHRWWRSSFLRWLCPGAHVSDRDEPHESHPSSLAPDRLDWLDRRLRPSRQRTIPIHYWRDGQQRRNLQSAAIVSRSSRFSSPSNLIRLLGLLR